VNRRRHIAWLTASLMAASLALLSLATSASAQSRSPGPGQQPGPFATTVQPPAPPRHPAVAPVADEPARQPAAPRPAEPDILADATLDPWSTEPPRPAIGRRPMIDGDLSWPPQPEPVIDGVVDPASEAPVDGLDPTIDTRPPEDYAPFEAPRADGERPAGDDPDIELGPILDRRPARLARFEPFDAVGIRSGGFIIFPEAEISADALGNLYRTGSNVRRDAQLDIRPQVRAVSNWRRHALEFRATGLSTFHAHYSSEDERGGTLEMRGRIDVTRRTNVEVLAGIDHGQEPRGSINAANRTGNRTEFETRRSGLTFNHRFNRLSIQLRGTVTDVDYSSALSDTGTLVSNDERDQRTREIAARAQWEFKPTFSIFAEAAHNWRSFGGTPSDGINRESEGDRIRTGISFGNTGNMVRGEVSVGHGTQRFADNRLPDIRGIIVDSNLAWRMTKLTSLLLTARTNFGESTLVGSGGSLSRTAGVEVRHAFRRHLIGIAGVSVTHNDYEGIEVSERETRALLGLDYYLNREVTLFGRYQHIDLDSTVAGRDYAADELRIGVRVRR